MRVLVALGGNALGDTPESQLKSGMMAAYSVANLIKDGHEVVIVYGNGPQVGMIQSAFDYGNAQNENIPLMPLAESGAMSQGYIGYHLQQDIYNVFQKEKINKPVIALVTQTVVDSNDSAFKNPTKPIGRFLSKAEGEAISKKLNVKVIEDSGRGYRVVVPSPRPVDIIEKDTIESLLNQGHVVIACGGGGIPVVKKDGITGVSAVIDKDFSSAKLAELIKADVFIILTDITRVSINYRKPNELEFSRLSVKEAQQYVDEEQFGKGSMEPKIVAAVSFMNSNPKGIAIIAALKDAALAIKGEAGTTIYHE